MTYIDGLSDPTPTYRESSTLSVTPAPTLGRRFLWAGLAVLVGVGSLSAALAKDVWTIREVKAALPPGHYLVLFQNNSELRPSGGFIGSFATVDLTATGYENLRVDTNIYKRDNAFAEQHTIAVPGPLEGVAADNKWTMRDSNWDIDFRDAAERVSWFYQQEGGESVDGVIAFNATVVQDLLKLTGPVALPDGSGLLDSESFFDTLHYKIEKEYFYDPINRTANEPKSILRSLIPTLITSARSPNVFVRLPQLLKQELRERQIQLYHTNQGVEAGILNRGWGGAIAETNEDFLLLSNASVGGRKSSLSIAQRVSVALSLQNDQLRHRLTIERTHTGDGVWPDNTNNNYLRVVVPAGATLLSATRNGTNVTSQVLLESVRGKTVFGLHLDTPAGTTSRLEIQYSIQSRPRRFVYQKQSGVLSEQLTVATDDRTVFDQLITADVFVPLQ
ncbi:DUF4012 domain-containing protein [Candidatus Berkelbacteria bacterium]|nr:DUF4012 domain-containing protein [Candidatus Berkelbacteria bacterium]